MKLNGLILFITAITLGSILLVPFLLSGLILSKSRNEYLLKIALTIDILGNVVGGPLFNRVLLKTTAYPFGSISDTISYVIAYNKHYGKLSKVGTLVGNILDFLDPGHTDLTLQRTLRRKYIN